MRRGGEIDQRAARRAATSSSTPHFSMFQSSSTWAAARPGPISSTPWEKGQRQQRRAGQRGHHMNAAIDQGSPAAPRAPRQSRLRLADMHDAFGQNEMRAELIGGPEHDRIPVRGFPFDQRLGVAGAVEQEIGLEIFRHVVGDSLDPVDDGVDDAVGKTRQRHGQGIDDFLLRFPSAAIASAMPRDRHGHLAAKACGSACRRG